MVIEGAEAVINLRVGGGFFFMPEPERKSLALSNLTFLFYSQNLKLEGTEDLSDVRVKQGN